MRLAIPVKLNRDNPPVAPLFGKAKWFAIVQDGELFSIIPNSQSGGSAVIELLHEIKIEAILIQEMGISPYEKIKEHGEMALYHTGFERILLNDVLEKFKNNELEILDDTNMDEIIKHHEKRHPRNHNHH
jgi:predicted Fe-Mo cluster-binding NifX family protein